MLNQYSGIAAVGVVAIMMIIIANMIGLPSHITKGLTFIGISVILLLASAVAFTFHWIVGIVGLIATAIVFTIGITSFSQTSSQVSTLLLQGIERI